MTIKPKTIGDIREAIKDLPDDMPVYLDDECFDECIAVLDIKQTLIGFYTDVGELYDVDALVFHYT